LKSFIGKETLSILSLRPQALRLPKYGGSLPFLQQHPATRVASRLHFQGAGTAPSPLATIIPLNIKSRLKPGAGTSLNPYDKFLSISNVTVAPSAGITAALHLFGHS
jgi:hypothetical protein